MGILKPFFRQVQPPIEQGLARFARIGQYDTGLAIGDLAQRTTVLAGDAHRVVALFGKITTIQDQHAIRAPQRLGHASLMGADHLRIRPGRLG